jgi:hypothetical protein
LPSGAVQFFCILQRIYKRGGHPIGKVVVLNFYNLRTGNLRIGFGQVCLLHFLEIETALMALWVSVKSAIKATASTFDSCKSNSLFAVPASGLHA